MPTSTAQEGGADMDSDAAQDLFALLPHDIASHLLICAGGPSSLQGTRSTSQAWKAALDSLVVKASCINLPSTCCSSSGCCAVLAQLPQLHTVDFSSCCQPLPAGHLGKVLVELSALQNLRTLQLSTWTLAQGPSTAPDAGHPAGQLQDSQHADGGPSTATPAHAGSSGTTTVPPQYDVMLPTEVACMTNLRELVISTCAEVTAPFARRLELAAGLMQLPGLTRLELHGFLPPVHHLRGLKHLQHLAITVPQCSAEAATADAAGGRLQQSSDAISAAKAAVQSLPGLTSLHVQLSARQFGHLLDPTSIVVGVVAGELLELLSAASTNPSPSTAAHPAPACRLQQLRLTQSGGLYHLPAKFAVGCSGLQELDLSCSRLTVEAAAVLGGLTGLTSLCLAESRLHEVPASWAALTQLQVLDISGNPLGSLPPFLSRLQALNQLVLASTHLPLLPVFISCLTALQHLNLASNKLQDLPVELCSCTGLVHLDVSKNRLLTLPEQFSALSHITQLSLTGNHLETLPSCLHGLRCLSHLGLALNYYKAWTHAVPCFASLAHTLQDLELQHTATVLDDVSGFLAVIGQLTALTSLAAGSNQLSDLPEAWQQLKRLKVLQLSHNAMESMPIGLLSLSALTYLDLSYNRLTALPFWIGSSKMQQLRRLNLAKNHLTTLPAEMSGLSRLTQLQLQGNNLASVPTCLGALHCLRVLNIGGNYKLKEGGLGQQLAGLGSLRDVVLPYRLDKAAGELRAAGKAVTLD